jgi:hypothetical protein
LRPESFSSPIVPVSTKGSALKVIVSELEFFGLLSRSHIAWLDGAEDIWRGYRPFPEPMPWGNHLEHLKAFLNEPSESRFRRVSDELAAKLSVERAKLKEPKKP